MYVLEGKIINDNNESVVVYLFGFTCKSCQSQRQFEVDDETFSWYPGIWV